MITFSYVQQSSTIMQNLCGTLHVAGFGSYDHAGPVAQYRSMIHRGVPFWGPQVPFWDARLLGFRGTLARLN